ncbi:MAG: protein-tyrosine-phosphatase [Myxococcota bacterium]
MRYLPLVVAFGCAVPSPAPPAEQRPAPLLSVDVPAATPGLNTALIAHVGEWLAAGKPATVNAEREASLRLTANWIREQRGKSAPANLTFVCTHNSRRSHIAQLWALAAARHLGLDHVQTYSGGTEATAFNPRAVAALRTHGFEITEAGEVLGERNVVYTTQLGPDASLRSFSKTYGDASNPSQGFAAVMVCSEADAACPIVEGADLRVGLPFIDPKLSDGTPEEAATYLAKSEEIGREIVWMMSMAAAIPD